MTRAQSRNADAVNLADTDTFWHCCLFDSIDTAKQDLVASSAAESDRDRNKYNLTTAPKGAT